MDTDAITFALLVGGTVLASNLVGIVEGLLLGHWLKTRKKRGSVLPLNDREERLRDQDSNLD